jgi:hypothetical protein
VGKPVGVVVVGDHVGVAGLRLDGAEAGPVIVVAVADKPGQVGGRGSNKNI